MTVSSPLEALQHLEQLYQRGFRDAVTDAALLKVASSQAARDEAALRDLERDLGELEQHYQMSSEELFQRWTAGKLADSADYMDWNALYQMAREVRERLELLRGQTEPV
ncbi:MAG: hypothetical protein BroJett011_24840 [Chloroflexota bacterium]|nr:MAG: hypothetical protein BroJett011_24840 [Chloroflexota bacterium]